MPKLLSLRVMRFSMAGGICLHFGEPGIYLGKSRIYFLTELGEFGIHLGEPCVHFPAEFGQASFDLGDFGPDFCNIGFGGYVFVAAFQSTDPFA